MADAPVRFGLSWDQIEFVLRKACDATEWTHSVTLHKDFVWITLRVYWFYKSTCPMIVILRSSWSGGVAFTGNRWSVTESKVDGASRRPGGLPRCASCRLPARLLSALPRRCSAQGSALLKRHRHNGELFAASRNSMRTLKEIWGRERKQKHLPSAPLMCLSVSINQLINKAAENGHAASGSADLSWGKTWQIKPCRIRWRCVLWPCQRESCAFPVSQFHRSGAFVGRGAGFGALFLCSAAGSWARSRTQGNFSPRGAVDWTSAHAERNQCIRWN